MLGALTTHCQQIKGLESHLSGHDVLVILPTG